MSEPGRRFPEPVAGFKVITVESWVKAGLFEADGLPAANLEPDEPYLMISQPDAERRPGTLALVYMTLSEAREFHRKLGDMLARVPE